MGVFDTYGDTQLKAGEPWQNHYKPGDKVPISDGIYIDFDEPMARQKAVAVKDGIFIGELDIYNYWGEKQND
jgi:hypothetical protein